MRRRNSLFVYRPLRHCRPAPVHAQKVIDLTVDVLDRCSPPRKQKMKRRTVAPQLADADQRSTIRAVQAGLRGRRLLHRRRMGGLAPAWRSRPSAARRCATAFAGPSEDHGRAGERGSVPPAGFKLDDYRVLTSRRNGIWVAWSRASPRAASICSSTTEAVGERVRRFGVVAEQAGAARSMVAVDGTRPLVWNTETPGSDLPRCSR